MYATAPQVIFRLYVDWIPDRFSFQVLGYGTMKSGHCRVVNLGCSKAQEW